MKSIKKILVCLDPTREEQPAIDKAIYLAKSYGASIELFLVVYNRSLIANNFFDALSLKRAKLGYINSQKRWAETYVAQIVNEKISCNIDVVWHKPIYEAIIQKVEKFKPQLVIKSTHHHPTINKLFFSPNDWQLLKYCPVPLILAKKSKSKNYSSIMAAVDPSNSEHEDLNSLIMKQATDFAKKLNSNCHVAHCFEPINMQLWSDIGFGMGIGMGPADFSMGEENYQEYLDQLKNEQQKSFDKVIKKFKFDKKMVHLEEGYAELMLPNLVKDHAIDLLVVGTSSHSGLIGSTVEKILDEVNCDILSVRLKTQ